MNHTRELKPTEWVSFFNDFSRIYKGRPVTVEMLAGDGHPTVIAHRLPLIGVTAEPPAAKPPAIEVVAGTPDDGHLMHVINNPSHVRVQQVTNGHDEFLIIESDTDPTIRVDFRVIDTERAVDDVFGAHEAGILRS